MNILFILALCPVLAFSGHHFLIGEHESENGNENLVSHITGSSASVSNSRSTSGASGTATRAAAAGYVGHIAYATHMDGSANSEVNAAGATRNSRNGDHINGDHDGNVTKVYHYEVHSTKGQQTDGQSPMGGKYSSGESYSGSGATGEYQKYSNAGDYSNNGHYYGQYSNGDHTNGHYNDDRNELHGYDTGNSYSSGSGSGYISGTRKIYVSGPAFGYSSGTGQGYSSGTGSGYISGTGRGYTSDSGSGYISGTGHGYTSGSSDYNSGNAQDSDNVYITGSGTGQTSDGHTRYTSSNGHGYTSDAGKVYTSSAGQSYSSGNGNGYTGSTSGNDYTGHSTSGHYAYGTNGNNGYTTGSGKSYTGTKYPSNTADTHIIITGNGKNQGRETLHTAHTQGYTPGTSYTQGSGKSYSGTGGYSSGTTSGTGSNHVSGSSQTRHTASTRHAKSSRGTTESDHDEQTTETMSSSRRTTSSPHQMKSTVQEVRVKTTRYREDSHENTIGECNCNKFEIAHQWAYFNFTWSCPLKMAQLKYNPVDYIPLSIDVFNHSIYMSFPRLRRNSRITLAKMCLSSSKTNPLMTPFPSWDMNSGLTCESLQDVTGIEIDKEGVMWVLDGRRLNPSVNCPPKIVLLDLKHNGKLIKKYEIPENLCKKRGCLLNDIVVDGDYAFISDLSAGDEGVIVYNRRKNRAWKARAKGHDESNFRHHSQDNCNPNMYNYEMSRAVAWLALAPPCSSRNRTFLYIPESLPFGYGINVDILKDERKATGDLTKYMTEEFSKTGATSAAIYDSKGTLYLGLLSQKTVAFKYVGQKELMVCPRHPYIRYPGQFAIDNDSETLYMTEMSSLNLAMNGVDVRKINFKLLKMKIDSKNYMQCSARH